MSRETIQLVHSPSQVPEFRVSMVSVQMRIAVYNLCDSPEEEYLFLEIVDPSCGARQAGR